MASNAHEARLPALTSLRFFAALYVLTFHSGASLMREHLGDNPLTTFLVNGHLGVSFFFILSGFMLTYSGERRNARGFDLSVYALARFARIYPLYLLSLLIAAPIRWPDLLSSPLASLETLLMVQSWGPASSGRGWFWNMPAWTLSIEAFFYALFPVFLWLIARTRMTTAASIAAGAGLLITVFALPDITPGSKEGSLRFGIMSAFPLPVLRLPEFIMGMALAHIVWLRPHLVKERLAGPWLLATAIASVGLLSFHGQRSFTMLASLGFGIIILLACYNKSGWRSGSQLLAAEWLVLLGGASYAIYLLEAPFRDWIRVLLTGPFEWTGRVVYLPALIALGVFTYLYFESPLRRLLTRSVAPTPPNQPYEEEADDLLGVRMKKSA